MVHPFSHYQQSADLIRSRMGDFTPDIALVLGSGLGFLGDMVEQPVAIPYGDIPHFPRSTAPGHAGRLVLGTLAGKRVAVMQGRMHHYEGWSYEEVSYPVRVLKLIGCETLILTNAAGCVNTAWAPGDIMVISDQIKIFMESPLRGENLAEFGPRFPDMSRAPRSWVLPCGRGSTATSPAPSSRPRPRSVWPGPWGATPWVCPPLPRPLWPSTPAWRCWASPL